MNKPEVLIVGGAFEKTGVKMSQAPHVIRGLRGGLKPGQSAIVETHN